MAIRNSYVSEAGAPVIDHAKCTQCLRCVKACPTETLYKGDPLIEVNPDTELGCIGCLQCGAVCPEDAIRVTGRAIAPTDLIPLAAPELKANAEQLAALLTERRSVRRFKDREVERDVLERIIELTSTAPMGIPPSDVRLEVFDTREKVSELARDLLENLKRSLPVLKLFASPLGSLFTGRAAAAQFENFVLPMTRELVRGLSEDRDLLLYDAPAVLYFHGTPWADAADVTIACTYAMLAAESLGLGSCMIGSLHPFLIQNKQLSEKYGVPKTHKHGIVLILGYPAVTYQHAIQRRLGRVTWQ